eukprot:jgi/Mesvir1/8213/Mv12504-RA.1
MGDAMYGCSAPRELKARLDYCEGEQCWHTDLGLARYPGLFPALNACLPCMVAAGKSGAIADVGGSLESAMQTDVPRDENWREMAFPETLAAVCIAVVSSEDLANGPALSLYILVVSIILYMGRWVRGGSVLHAQELRLHLPVVCISDKYCTACLPVGKILETATREGGPMSSRPTHAWGYHAGIVRTQSRSAGLTEALVWRPGWRRCASRCTLEEWTDPLVHQWGACGDGR